MGEAALARLARLAAAARVGDRAAREELLARLGPLVEGAARRATWHARRLGLGSVLNRDDLAQEARALLLDLIDRCDPAAGPPLLYFTVRLRTRLRQFVEAQARRRPPGQRVRLSEPVAQDLCAALSRRLFDEAQSLAVSGVEAALYDALAALSPRQRRLLYFRFWRDLPDAETAAALRTSVAGVRQTRQRALATLRAALRRAKQNTSE